MPADSSTLRDQLLGAWRLVSCVELFTDGQERFPIGNDATGLLIYTSDGRISAQLVRNHRPRFPSDDYRIASSADASSAFQSYFGYFGTFEIDDVESGTVIHHIEGAWFPNLAGVSQKRIILLDGDDLTIDATTPWGKIRNVWKRLTPVGK